jgi:hypothetical protein
MMSSKISGVILYVLFLSLHHQEQVSAIQAGRKPSIKYLEGPVIKSFKRPVLTVIDPKTKSRIHLVGVCHGSASSANLVKEIFAEVKPAAVVLELCDDRFYSISLEAKIRPRGNETQGRIFDDEMEVIKNAEIKAKEKNEVLGTIAQLNNVLKFVSQQGFVGGTFVLLSLCVNNLQRLFRFNTGDYFQIFFHTFSIIFQADKLFMCQHFNFKTLRSFLPRGHCLLSFFLTFFPLNTHFNSKIQSFIHSVIQ